MTVGLTNPGINGLLDYRYITVAVAQLLSANVIKTCITKTYVCFTLITHIAKKISYADVRASYARSRILKHITVV